MGIVKKLWIIFLTIAVFSIGVTAIHFNTKWSISVKGFLVMPVTWLVFVPCLYWWHDYFTDLFDKDNQSS